MKYLSFAILIAGVAALLVHAGEVQQQDREQPVELGDVDWLRNLDSAVAKSKQESKPIAILFQEVPG